MVISRWLLIANLPFVHEVTACGDNGRWWSEVALVSPQQPRQLPESLLQRTKQKACALQGAIFLHPCLSWDLAECLAQSQHMVGC